jgi:hypothetical protein
MDEGRSRVLDIVKVAERDAEVVGASSGLRS